MNIELLKQLFHSSTIAVVGDVMWDMYTYGSVKRISPEAPVPILHVDHCKELLGGAGNVVLNILALGCHVKFMTRVGADTTGTKIIQALEHQGLQTKIVVEADFITPKKHRMVASHQQLLRLDEEQYKPMSAESEAYLNAQLTCFLEGVQVLAISDYGKGMLQPQWTQTLIQEAKKRDIFVIVDPKGHDFSKYCHADMIKPNLHEALLAAHQDSHSCLENVAQILLESIDVAYLAITRSEHGISLFSNNPLTHVHFPAVIREVKDVTGAGDTVLAMLACCTAANLELHHAIELANIAAGFCLEKIGCAHMSLEELKHYLQESKTVANCL